MKLHKQIILLTVVILTSFQSYSQISAAGQLGVLRSSLGLSFGIGARVDYAKNDRTVFQGGFNFYLPTKFDGQTDGVALDNATVPEYISVPLEHKASFMHVTIGARRYFVGDYEDDFGFYGFAEVGLLYVPVRTTVGEYDATKYSVSSEVSENINLLGYTIGFGIGLEKELDFGYLFSDLKINLPANEANGVAISVVIPTTFALSAGVRIPIN
jgi:hypothetical protein